MSLYVSLEEFELIAHRASELAERMRAARFVFGAIPELDRASDHLASIADHLRETSRRYRGGESLLTSAFARLTLALTPVATALTWIGSMLRVLPSGEVQIRTTSATACSSPVGFAQLLERIPQSQQVRIDRLESQGHSRYVVYIAGTQDFGFHVSANPWDMTSNLQALSNVATADSERAVLAAMAQAGIDNTTPITLVGHSQGGLIASRIASRGDFNVTDVVVAGSPSHTVKVPEQIRITAFEHTDDLIPLLSGPALAGVAASTLRIRQAAPPASTNVSLPAHDLDGYVATAREADASMNKEIQSRRAAVAQPGASCSTQESSARRGR